MADDSSSTVLARLVNDSSTSSISNPLAIFKNGIATLDDLTVDAQQLGTNEPIELYLPGDSTVARDFINLELDATCPAGYEIVRKIVQKTVVCQPCAAGTYLKSGSCSEAPRDVDCGKGSTVSWCLPCPSDVECLGEGSTVSDWVLKPGHWRTDSRSDDVLRCRFGVISCPPNANASTTGPNPYCSADHVGPLCSACAANHFLSWTGDGKCHQCATGESHAPTIGLYSGVVLFVIVCLACVYKKASKTKAEEKNKDATPQSPLRLNAAKVYSLAKFKVFTLFLTSQVLSA